MPKLLLFEEALHWEQELQNLKGLEKALTSNPALHMTDIAVDNVSWGLIGAAPFFGRDDLLFVSDYLPNVRDATISDELRELNAFDWSVGFEWVARSAYAGR